MCTVHEDVVQYLGDDEGKCELYTPKDEPENEYRLCVGTSGKERWCNRDCGLG